MFHKHHNLFQDPQIDYPIADLNLNFTDYIAKCRDIIANARVDLSQNAELIINANTPFEMRPQQPGKGKTKYGALLIHGLFDCPFIMKDIGLHLNDQGLLVRSILLPGHGTVPGGLLNVDYHAWLQTVRYGIASLIKEVDHIFLVGFSTGASLALYQALDGDIPIAGLILISPALKIRSKIDFTANWHRIISWAWERAKWFHIAEEDDYTKYQSIPFNAIYQVYRLAKKIKAVRKVKQLNCPIFMALSQDDTTVSSDASIEYFRNDSHQSSRMIIYAHKVKKINDRRIIMRSSAYPELNIVDYSHVAVPIAPSNSHYGKNGDYIYASHVGKKSKIIYGAYNKVEMEYFELLHKLKLTRLPRQRLSFNPDFDYLMGAIDQFIISSV